MIKAPGSTKFKQGECSIAPSDVSKERSLVTYDDHTRFHIPTAMIGEFFETVELKPEPQKPEPSSVDPQPPKPFTKPRKPK